MSFAEPTDVMCERVCRGRRSTGFFTLTFFLIAVGGCGDELGERCDDCEPVGAVDGGATDAGRALTDAGAGVDDAGAVDIDAGTDPGVDGAVPVDSGLDAGSDAGRVEPPPFEPLLRIPVRVHIGGGGARGADPSELTDAELAGIFEEMNLIWFSQAGICFEFETTFGAATLRGEGLPGFDLWFAPRVPGSRANGVYFGRRDDAWTRDEPGLGRAPNPVMYPAARTAAHELGHGLSLPHNNCGDCRDFLMASGTRGWQLLEGRREFDGEMRQEISNARRRAQRTRNGQPELALPDTAPMTCAPPVFAPRP